MGADACSLFLHDFKTDELWSTVAWNGGRGHSDTFRSGLGRGMFSTGETINLKDAYETHGSNRLWTCTQATAPSLLCMPLRNRLETCWG